jgi:hypothetical protein
MEEVKEPIAAEETPAAEPEKENPDLADEHYPQLDALKAKYGRVYTLCGYTDEGEPVRGYLHKASRETLGACMSLAKSNPIQAGTILMQNTIVKDHSDMRLLNDTDVFMSVFKQIQELLAFKTGAIKKN